MSRPPILQPNTSYTFGSYFEMNYIPDEILAEFGYVLKKESLIFPETERLLDITELKERLTKTLFRVSLTTESARQQTLVAPVLLEVAFILECFLEIEYPLTVNNWLKGSLDYLLKSNGDILVVEAKRDDLTRGFVQMAVELIAIAQIEEDSLFYGAVTNGQVWQFGILDKSCNTIKQDINLYLVPNQLEQLMKILIAILE